jgi:hypothetical protein
VGLAGVVGQHRELGAVGQPELGERAGDVRFDRSDRQVQARGDLGACLATSSPAE